ncbi:MAG: PEP-CTERM sorting domain-containing protein [Bryobacterales bacterium]|nr:PEP-CTERM sorting domain-containing protein [Bryobacterales bacterium]
MRRYVCAFLCMLLVSAASAGVIFSEDFEGGVNQDVIAIGLIAGTQFEVVTGNVDHIKDDADPANPYATMCGTGGSCIDTTGSGSRGEIRSTVEFNFLPGIYYLSFSLQGWRDSSNNTASANVQVLLPGLVDTVFARTGTHGPYDRERIQFDVFAPQTVKLTFRDLSGSAGYAGAILDDVEIGTATPEPSTLLLLLPALAAVAALRRRSSGNGCRPGA